MAESSEYPLLPGFHFRVEFLDLGGKDIDTRFQSVAGLSVDMETESLAEGGENRFQHELPTRTSYGTLTLQRGLPLRDATALIDWCMRTMNTLEIHPTDITVSLLNREHQPVVTWNVKRAWPKKWAVSDFDAESSELVIETLELGYQTFALS